MKSRRAQGEGASAADVAGSAELPRPVVPPDAWTVRTDVFPIQGGITEPVPVFCCNHCEHNTTEFGVAADHARRFHPMKSKEA